MKLPPTLVPLQLLLLLISVSPTHGQDEAANATDNTSSTGTIPAESIQSALITPDKDDADNATGTIAAESIQSALVPPNNNGTVTIMRAATAPTIAPTNTPTYFSNTQICSSRSEKAIVCGAKARPDRGYACCEGLTCGGNKGVECVLDTSYIVPPERYDTCATRWEKSVLCGAQDVEGRGYACCPGLKCGGFEDVYCIVDENYVEPDFVEEDAFCGAEGDKAVSCGAKAKDGRAAECCPGLKCDGQRCVDKNYVDPKKLGFLWRMWHEKDIKWSHRGNDFCVMCRNYTCTKNDYVVTTHCNANQDHMRWEWVKVDDDGKTGLMKTKTENLCLENVKAYNYTLRPCSKKNKNQQFKGLDYDEKFILYPAKVNKGSCMTMLHHPLAGDDNDGEMIRDQKCFKAKKTDTAFWTADFRPTVKEELYRTNPRCNETETKCGACEGWCDDDSDCREGLYCYKRGEQGWRTNLEMKVDPNPWAAIPGCSGFGKFGKNYCSEKRYKTPYTDKEIEKILGRPIGSVDSTADTSTIPTSDCSPEGEKAVKCGAKEKDGRAKKCCDGLQCGGLEGVYCVR